MLRACGIGVVEVGGERGMQVVQVYVLEMGDVVRAGDVRQARGVKGRGL